MKIRTKRRFFPSFAALLLGAALTVSASPWDSWRMAYTSFEKGEKLRDSGDYTNALTAFTEALKHYQSVKVSRPDWNQRVISERIAECERERSKIQALLGKSAAPAKQIEQGGRQMAVVSSQVEHLKRLVAEKNAEIDKLKANAGREKRLEAEIANLIRDQRQSAEKYALLKRQLESREKAAELPSALAQKLKTRLQEEKVRTETLSRQVEDLSAQLKKRDENARTLMLDRDSAQLELKRTREALAAKKKAETDGKSAEVSGLTPAELQSVTDAEARQRLVALEASLQRVTSARNAIEKENLSLRSSLEQAQKSQQESSAKLAKELEARSKLDADIRMLTQKNRELQNRLDERAGKDFADLTAGKEKLDRINAELDQAQTSLLNWKHQAESLTLEKQQLTADLKNAEEAAKKAQEKQQQMSGELQKALSAADQLRDLPAKYQELQKNFAALQAENRENRLLAEAAKPREAELANIKLRLADLDRLKGDLAREQRLNGELLVSVRKLEKQLAASREKESQFLSLKMELPDIEALRADLAKYQKLNSELVSGKRTEGDVSALKVKLADAEARAADRDRLQRINAELLAMQKAQRAELIVLENEKRDLSLQKMALAPEGQATKDGKTVDLQQEKLRLAQENLKLQTSLAQQTRMTEDARRDAAREKAQSQAAATELASLRRINAELAAAKALEGEVAKLKLQLAEAETAKGEVARLERLCRELTADRNALEEELTASRNSPVPGVDIIPSPVKENPDDLVASGALAESEGNLELAIWHYRQALQANKEHAAAAKRLGRIRFQRQEYRDAMSLLAIARTADPKDAELGYMAVSCSIALKRYGNARAMLEPLLKLHPNDWRLQMSMALVEMGCGETANAEKRLQFAQRLAPAQTAPRIELARIVATTAPNRREEAARIYESARSAGAAPDLELERLLADVLDKRRDSASFLQAAAGEAESAGDWKSAVWYYRQLQDLDWTPETTIPKLAFARYKEGNSAAALEVLQFAKPGKNSALAEIVSMLVRYRSGNPIGAVEASRRALSVNGGVPVEIPADCGALNAELAAVFADTGKAEVKICREAYRGF